MEQKSVNLDGLSPQQRINGFKAHAAMLQGKKFDDIDSTPFEELDEKGQLSYLELQIKHLDARRDMYLAEKQDEDLPDKLPPRSYLAARFKNPVANDEVIVSIAAIHGFENPTNQDYASLAEFYAGDGSTLENRKTIVTNFNNNAAEEAKQAAALEASKLELAEKKTALESKAEAAGLESPYDTSNTTAIQLQLPRYIKEKYGEESNVYTIDERLRAGDVVTAERVVDFTLENNDTREMIMAKLNSGDEAQISQAQHVLGVEATGEINLATSEAALDHLKTSNGLGEEYYYVFSDTISYELLEKNLENGVIPIVKEGLPESLQTLAGTDMGNSAIAMHLSEPENFKAYSNYLKTEYTAQLETKYAADLQANIERLDNPERAQQLDERQAAMDANEIPANASPTAIIADSRKLPEYIKEFTNEEAAEYFAKIDVDSRKDGEAPQELKRLASLKVRIEHALKEAEVMENDPTADINPINIKGNLSRSVSQFQNAFENLSAEEKQQINDYLDKTNNAPNIKTPAQENTAPTESTPKETEPVAPEGSDILITKSTGMSVELYNDFYHVLSNSDLSNAPEGMEQLQNLNIAIESAKINLLEAKNNFLANNPDTDFENYETPTNLRNDLILADNKFIDTFLNMPEDQRGAIISYVESERKKQLNGLEGLEDLDELDLEINSEKGFNLSSTNDFGKAASPIEFPEGGAQEYAAQLQKIGNSDDAPTVQNQAPALA